MMLIKSQTMGFHQQPKEEKKLVKLNGEAF